MFAVTDDDCVPSSSITCVLCVAEDGTRPAVWIVKLQGSIVTVCPTANGDPVGKVDWSTVKMQDPYEVLPVAVPCAEDTLKVDALENVNVVAPDVPKPETPLENVNELPVTDETVDEVTFDVRSLAATTFSLLESHQQPDSIKPLIATAMAELRLT